MAKKKHIIHLTKFTLEGICGTFSDIEHTLSVDDFILIPEKDQCKKCIKLNKDIELTLNIFPNKFVTDVTFEQRSVCYYIHSLKHNGGRKIDILGLVWEIDTLNNRNTDPPELYNKCDVDISWFKGLTILPSISDETKEHMGQLCKVLAM